MTCNHDNMIYWPVRRNLGLVDFALEVKVGLIELLKNHRQNLARAGSLNRLAPYVIVLLDLILAHPIHQALIKATQSYIKIYLHT